MIVNLIGATKTTKGLRVDCELDDTKYEQGRKVSNKEFNKINLIKDNFHGEWNYKIVPDTAMK